MGHRFEDGSLSVWSEAPGTTVRLTFSEHSAPKHEVGSSLVTIEGSGLVVNAGCTFPLFDDGLVHFLEERAEDFRGWNGVRSWQNLERQLGIDARWEDGGHVTLAFWLRSACCQPDWRVEADILVEAGAALQSLAIGFSQFFADG